MVSAGVTVVSAGVTVVSAGVGENCTYWCSVDHKGRNTHTHLAEKKLVGS